MNYPNRIFLFPLPFFSTPPPPLLLSEFSNWLIAIPPDVIKSRLQTHTDPNINWMAIYRELMKEEGIAALYRGVGPAMMRAFPANASCFLGMEFSRSLLNSYC